MKETQFALLMSMAFLNLSVLFIILHTLDGEVMSLVMATLALGTALGTDAYGLYHNGIPFVSGGGT